MRQGSCHPPPLPMMAVVMPASRSLIALLVGTAVFFALWIFALKPSSSSSGAGGSSSSQGLGAYRSDINKAHQAVGVSKASSAASGNDSAAPGASSPPAATGAPPKAATAPGTSTGAKPAAPSPTAQASAAQSFSTVQHAIDAHKVAAMLFYNAYATDDQAVKQELGSVPTHTGEVIKLAIPLSQAANFTAVTQQVPLNLSPTLVLIAPGGQASEIVGYTTAFEIGQRVDDALAAH